MDFGILKTAPGTWKLVISNDEGLDVEVTKVLLDSVPAEEHPSWARGQETLYHVIPAGMETERDLIVSSGQIPNWVVVAWTDADGREFSEGKQTGLLR